MKLVNKIKAMETLRLLLKHLKKHQHEYDIRDFKQCLDEVFQNYQLYLLNAEKENQNN